MSPQSSLLFLFCRPCRHDQQLVPDELHHPPEAIMSRTLTLALALTLAACGRETTDNPNNTVDGTYDTPYDNDNVDTGTPADTGDEATFEGNLDALTGYFTVEEMTGLIGHISVRCECTDEETDDPEITCYDMEDQAFFWSVASNFFDVDGDCWSLVLDRVDGTTTFIRACRMEDGG